MTIEASMEAPEFEPVPLMEDLPSEDIPLEMEDNGGYVEELDISDKEELDVEVYFIFFLQLGMKTCTPLVKMLKIVKVF